MASYRICGVCNESNRVCNVNGVSGNQNGVISMAAMSVMLISMKTNNAGCEGEGHVSSIMATWQRMS